MCFELRALCLHFSVGTPPTLWLHAELLPLHSLLYSNNPNLQRSDRPWQVD